MKIGFVVNQVKTEKVVYTTVHLAYKALQMGHEVYFMGVDELVYFPEGHIGAQACTVDKGIKTVEEFLQCLQEEQKAKKKAITSHDLDVLWIRNDPSVDIEGRPWAQAAGVFFGKIALNQGVIVLNHPDTLFNTLNKMYFQHFPESVRPRTIITRNAKDIRKFYEENNQQIVLKPLQGSGGRDVFLLNDKENNLNQIVEAIARHGFIIAQEYLPEASKGDVRLLVMNGQAILKEGKYAAVRRVNRKDDFRSNVSAGGKAVSVKVNQAMLNIVERVRPKLMEDGVFFVGLDIVGDKLVEVNVFSPGGLYDVSNLEKIDFCEPVIEAIERKVYYKKLYGDQLDNKALAVM